MKASNTHQRRQPAQPARVAKPASNEQAKRNEGYDKAVHAGAPIDEDGDAFERLERTPVSIDDEISDAVEAEALVAAIEGDGDAFINGGVLDDADLEPDDFALTVAPSIGSRDRADDDDEPISPEELGEQFLRGAVQQAQRSHNINDRESNDNVDLLDESVHQVSLFDHNQDPLAEPRFPRVKADETEHDAAHHADHRASSSRTRLAKNGRSGK